MAGKFENVIIASDMDGTFLTSRETGMDRNIRAVEYFKSQGGHFTFSTGRNYLQILSAVPQAPVLVNMPAVTCNGSSLYDMAAGVELEGHPVDKDTVQDLANFLATQPGPIGIRGGTSDFFVYNELNNPYIRSDFQELPPDHRAIQPTHTWGTLPINKLAVRAEAEILDRVRPLLTERFQGRLEVTRSDPTLVDIQAAGRTKAVLLEEVVRSRFDRSMFLCVAGDYDNDLEMLGLADLPCCPSNAVPCVKEVCEKIFCSNHEGVIGDIVEYLDRLF